MSNAAATNFQVPLVYPTPGLTREAVEQETLASLQKNKDMYQWELKDGYPPHVLEVPARDDKSKIEIFNVQALLQVGGMLQSDDKLSAHYFRLAPDPQAPTSLDALVTHNQSQRAPGGVNDNMLFRDRKKRDWHSDAVFAQQHFTGTNATTITLAKDWVPAFEERAEALGNAKMLNLLRSAPATSSYVQDYSYFRSAMGLSDDQELASGNGRYGCAPVALFQLGDNGSLHPLAIVIDYKGSMAASVVIFNKRLTPASANLDEEAHDWPWRYAKTCVQSADWLRHEVTIHLVNTHLVEEASIVAAHRTLPPRHIVYQLLEKHWDTTLPLNREARKVLIPEVITKLAGVGQTELNAFLNHAYSSFDWTGLRIPNDLDARGFPLGDIEEFKFHNYAYARNMARMWPVIRSFVAGVLGPYYDGGDEHVAADPYLQDFCNEMRSSQGAKMTSFPEIKSLDELLDTVTMCIHIASPQHTAVNYLQHYYQVFVPNKPWAMYTPLPRSLSELQGYKEKHLLDALPFKRTKDWLIGAQLPYLLSFEVIGQSSLLSYATAQSTSPIRVIADSARAFEKELKELQGVFRKNSDALDDRDTKYRVMDPAMTAVSILI
ncbi:lipoxygenase [Rhizoctonia solani AG-3 Rhs1AP]|uniref:Manganese lipoxygenase n=1 Tax=Rhizoctonia solani AG-3 Rhs1AP TaxID=1086054 RepID=X8JC18_9AGAM|nr:lipoxygenase [Rhizoctonia solani AG-3 Rhs1AP]